MINFRVNPQLYEAEAIIRVAIKNQQFFIIIGNCEIDYQGRANSKLSQGNRAIIIKKDGALLVHRNTGYKPVNWMPGKNVIYHLHLQKRSFKRQKEELVKESVNHSVNYEIRANQSPQTILEMKALRKKPSEVIRITFYEIHLISTTNLIDHGEFSLYASEADMQKAILSHPSLIEDGFSPISFEKKVDPGFVDIYGRDKKGNFVVIEIKRGKANREAVFQLSRYVEDIKTRVRGKVRGLLVAPHIAKGVQRLLAELRLEFKGVDPKKCASLIIKSQKQKLDVFFED